MNITTLLNKVSTVPSYAGLAVFVGLYGVMLLGDALGWPAAVQFAIAVVAVVAMPGVWLAVHRRNRRIGLDARGQPRRNPASYPRQSEWMAPTDTTEPMTGHPSTAPGSRPARRT